MDHQLELEEAIEACDRCIAITDDVLRKLSSARKWGVFDILGGGLVSSLIKHRRVKESEVLMKELEKRLSTLEKETRDVQVFLADRIETSDLMVFFDVVFDNIVVDWMVQSDIKTNNEKLNNLRSALVSLKKELVERYEAFM